MRNYECLFIVNPNFDGDGISTVIEKVTGYVKEADAEVANIQHWGKRRLAYQIEKQQYGNYVLMHLNGEAPKITDLQRSLELDDSVLAYLTVRLGEMPEFDKVMIPEDESEDDRRGGRSRYDDSRSRDRGSYSRDTRSPRPDKADTAEDEPATEVDDKGDADIDTSPEAEVKAEAETAVVKDDSEPKQEAASEEAEPVEAADDEKADADAGDHPESETADEAGEDEDDVEAVEDKDDEDKEVDDKKEEA
ncbi:MAG: 30S ribosomal protein S6 [Candidatus Marinimicrobia bacterium]|nr:30S ribosomal protein S6 [Candidatus Neomarinimicrobiota bacterium]MCF7840808.1 30S ribosomal protein S6 [Candidatus Neomarinimicrobiota bacterium]MCF7902202.1 30S ribosomal protein S6 [Candidatus Neomarinimicrobiota bacterium]